MDPLTASARVLDLTGRAPTDAYGLVARVFVDLTPGDAIQLVAERDLDQLVSTFRLVWDDEFDARALDLGPERWTYAIIRREVSAPSIMS